MTLRLTGGALLFLALLACQARSSEPPSLGFETSQDTGKDTKKQPDKDKTPPEKNATTPQTDVFSSALLPPREAPNNFNPNMLGDLLNSGRSQSYFLQRSRGLTAGSLLPAVIINGTGATNITNPSVAENNTAVPQDRLSFRFNYFNNALGVTGDSGQSVQVATVDGVPINQAILTTKKYNVYDYTFSFEKTFLNGFGSIEMRFPLSRTLSHNQTLSVADITGTQKDIDSNGATLLTNPTPERTLGQAGTELGNTTLILKGLLFRSETLVFSGGLAVNVPTARATHTQVVDFLGDTFNFDAQARRYRDFIIGNDTWSISPFVAFLVTPNDRLFAQGFVQYDQPVGSNRVSYSEFVDINAEPFHIPITPTSVTASIREQPLFHLDLGVGGWLFRDPQRSWITGIAPTVEFHYTSTLKNADILTLPASALYTAANGTVQVEPNPKVGNLRNRVDILDLTLGATFLFKDNMTIAAGLVLPMRQGDNRTFDWEFQVQLNYYFR
jgi:hypothetical protein